MLRGPLAQLVELRTFNPQVVGSIPTGPTKRAAFGRLFFVLGAQAQGWVQGLALNELPDGPHGLLELLCGYLPVFCGCSRYAVFYVVLQER